MRKREPERDQQFHQIGSNGTNRTNETNDRRSYRDQSWRREVYADEVSLTPPQVLDDLDAYYDPALASPPQRQQHPSAPASQRPPSSTGSHSLRSLRRTPRLQERRQAPPRTFHPAPRSPPRPNPLRQTGRRLQITAEPDVDFGQSGSTTPQSFQRLVEQDSYWPQRSTHISRRTHEAILFALEAIRTGNGVDAQALTPDLLEEEARMSDLMTGGVPAGGPSSGRSQNGAARAAAGPGATSAQPRFRTPTVVMAERRAREARRAEQEAAQRRQEEESRKQQTEEVVGVGERQGGGRTSVSEAQSAIPTAPGTRRRTDTVPTTNGAAPRTSTTIINSGQPRPVGSQQVVNDPTYSGQVHKNRSEALEKLSMPAIAGTKPPQPQSASYPQPTTSAQPSTRSAFPHAFERWETLSSHWEGLTSYWIRKLQSNTEELSSKPIDQQMARQITDLSAAGANLFHAVVELQRLRASSERKFQRWFFETRNEQEQAQERIAELERQLRTERDTGNQSSVSIEAVKAEKSKAEELVREMKRELLISKEEARRAWEELGRREQEDREHTIALRNGEPAVIGGVQVVPMAGAGLASRQATSARRPETRTGPIPGGPGPTAMSGQQLPEAFSRSQTTLESPEQEQAQFSYHPGGTSPTETDPFTETARANEPPQLLRHEPDTQFYTQQHRSQPVSSAAAIAARSMSSPSHSGSGSMGHPPQQLGILGNYPPVSAAATTLPPYRTGTAGTERSDRSYVQSASGNGSEEEYHYNPDGSFTRDAQGRRIPYGQPIGGPGDASDEEGDYADDMGRERVYVQQYAQRQPQARVNAGVVTSSGPMISHLAQISPQQRVPVQSQVSPESQHSYSSTISASSPQQASTVDHSSSYGTQQQSAEPTTRTGWESITARHQHPTRLSDIVEEMSGRTSPSRASYMSGGDYPTTTNGNTYGIR